jgi:uncharacterized metal-binding protein YceD (DUF177 family)
MDETFKIFVHRIKVEGDEEIEEILSPEFLDVDGEEIQFHSPVHLMGTAHVADGMLVLCLSVETKLTMLCAICNQPVDVKISIPSFYHTEPIAEIKGGVFDYRETLREAILLEIPYTTECNSGHCPERESMAKYFRKTNS